MIDGIVAAFEARRAEKRKGASVQGSGGKRGRSEVETAQEGSPKAGGLIAHGSPQAGTSTAPTTSRMRSYVSCLLVGVKMFIKNVSEHL